MACTPEESKELAELLARGKLGEVQGISIDFPEQQVPLGSTSPRLGLFHTARTMRAALGDWFGVNVVDPIIRTNIKRDNFVAAEYKAFKEAMAPLELSRVKGFFGGIPKDVDEQVGQALEYIDKGGKYFGAPNQFDPRVLQAATNLRAIYDRLFVDFKIDPDKYLKGYMPHLRKRPDGIMWKEDIDLNADEVMFRKQLKTEDIVFYHEMERKGVLTDPEMRASATFLAYINGLGRSKILRPVVEEMEKQHVNSFFGLKMYRSTAGNTYTVANDAAGYAFWREYVHHLFGGPTQADFNNVTGIRKLTQMFGYNIDTRSLYKFSQGLTNLQYSGALGSIIGGRPASILRQFTQLVPTYAVLGAKHTMAGIQRVMAEGVQPLIDKNMISSPLEHLIEAVDVQKGLGRTISGVSEASLKAFSAVDRFTRAATAYAAESKFMEYHTRGMFDKLRIRKDLKDEVTQLYNSGKIEEAKERYMFSTVNDLQYAFGRANRPKTWRGAIKGLGSIFLSYPTNTFEMVRMMGKEAIEGDRMPAVRLLGTTLALMTVGSELLNADMRSATLLGALPHSMAFPKTALDTYKVGTTSFDWLIGNTFGVGESDFAKYQRQQALNALGRDAKGLVPGGLFFFQDIPKAIDEGSIARWAALTPKAEQLNQYARERAAASASERERPLPTLRAY